MIEIRGEKYDTVVDAAKEFGVAPKTVYDWIFKKIIQRPEVVRQGVKQIQVFSAEYMKEAKRRIAAYENRQSKRK